LRGLATCINTQWSSMFVDTALTECFLISKSRQRLFISVAIIRQKALYYYLILSNTFKPYTQG
jgi:hypothetical protein